MTDQEVANALKSTVKGSLIYHPNWDDRSIDALLNSVQSKPCIAASSVTKLRAMTSSQLRQHDATNVAEIRRHQTPPDRTDELALIMRKRAIERQYELSLRIQQSKRVIEASISTSILFFNIKHNMYVNTPGHTRMGFANEFPRGRPSHSSKNIFRSKLFKFFLPFSSIFFPAFFPAQKSVGHVTRGN